MGLSHADASVLRTSVEGPTRITFMAVDVDATPSGFKAGEAKGLLPARNRRPELGGGAASVVVDP